MKFIYLKTTLVLSGLLSFCYVSTADTLSGTGALQTWNATALGTSSAPTPSGTPYWNNLSGDGPTNNIGWCLTGTGGCSLSNPPGTIPYYGNSNGTAATSMQFTSNGSPVMASLLGIHTMQVGTDYFGWYSITSSNTLGALTPLFNSSTAIGSSATFSPTAQYGYYFENVQGAGTANEADYYWFTNSSLDYAAGTGVSDNLQHFATFAPATGFIFGMEDTNGAASDRDFNDMIVQVQNTPEPMTVTLLGSGLILVGVRLRRRSRQN